MEICYIIWKFPSPNTSTISGGAEKQLQKLVTELNKRGYYSTIIASKRKNESTLERFHDKTTIHRLPTSSVPGLSMIQFMFALPVFFLRLNFKKKFRVIHLFLPDLYIIPIYFLTRFLKVPVISRIAADELEDSNNRGLWRIIRYIIKSFILKTDAIHTLNPKAFQLAKQYNKSKARVYLIPNGVIIPKIQRDYSKINNTILYIGAMRYFPNKLKVEQKNLVYLIDAFEEAVRRLPNLRLVMVGDGNYREFLESYCKKKGLSDRIQFTGFQSDVWPYLVQTDMLVNPSHFEGMPNTVIEAMAMGVYVICSDIPEHRFLIENNRYGQLVDKSQFTSLVNEILNFYETPLLYILRANAGKKKIEEQLSLSIISTQIISMYQNII